MGESLREGAERTRPVHETQRYELNLEGIRGSDKFAAKQDRPTVFGYLRKTNQSQTIRVISYNPGKTPTF